MANESNTIVIYTDGGCDPNPGPGGWAAILRFGNHRKELFGGFRETTNNRMEIYAAIAGLRDVKKRFPIILLSDSRYLVDGMVKGWVVGWQARGWRRNNGGPALNVDLWKELLKLTAQFDIRFEWIRGHSGVSDNERCDELVAEGRRGVSLPVDRGYSGNRYLATGSTTAPSEGQQCRKCSTPLERRVPKRWIRPGQPYYFEYYFYCPGCHRMYMVEEARRPVE